MTIIVLATVFGCGAALLSFEILGSRVIAPYFGSSTTVWACLIGVFLAALSAGNLLGGRAADWKPTLSMLAMIIALAAVTSATIPLISSKICAWIVQKRFGYRIDPLLASTLLFFLPAFFLGGVTPFAIRLLLPSVERSGITAGGVYALSTAGSIFGLLVTALYLIQTFGVRKIWFCWSALLLVLGAVLLIKPTVRKRRAQLLPILLLTCLVGYASSAQGEIIYERDTLYHHILVDDAAGLRTLWFDAAPQSSMSIINPVEGGLEYTDYFHVPFVFNQHIRRVLFVGLGGGSGPKRFLYDYPDIQVDVVEIDPVVVEVAEQFFFVTREPKLNIVVEDGRVFLARANQQYDLIVVDAYLSSEYGPYIPFHLATREFFEQARERLTVAGVLVYNIIGTVLGPESSGVRSIYRTMSDVFPSLYMFPAETSRNVVIIATKSMVNYTPAQVYQIGSRLFLERKVRIPAFLRRLMRCIAWAPAVEDVPVLTDDFAPMESLQAGGFATQRTDTEATEGEEPSGQSGPVTPPDTSGQNQYDISPAPIAP